MSLVGHFDTPGIDRLRYEDIPDIERRVLGLPIPFRVVVRKESDQSVVLDQTFESLCTTGWSKRTKYRDIAWLRLPSGYYMAEVTNLHEQPDLTGVKTTLTLRGIEHK